jgi:hypothetical protein
MFKGNILNDCSTPKSTNNSSGVSAMGRTTNH